MIYHIKKSLFLIFLWFIFSSKIDFEYKNIKTEKPLSIHLIELDPQKHEIKPCLANSSKISRDTVLNIVKKNSAKAGINAGFFKENGLPSGILKIDGSYISLPIKTRGSIGWDRENKKFLIDQLDSKAYLITDGREILVDGINRIREKNERILYFWPFFLRETLNQTTNAMVLSDNFFLATDPNDDIVKILKYNNFDYKIDILAQKNPSSSYIFDNLDYIVGGTPLLIFDREKTYDYSSEKPIISFLVDRHARTAIGIKENGNLIFLVVDGQDKEKSLGMTIDELRDFMFDLDCIYALNLDGGSSSSMVIENELINEPISLDGTIDRKVSNAILIFEKK